MYLKRLGVVALALFLVFGMLFPMPALAAEASEDLYRTIVKDIMAEHGGLWFDESSYECSARGVFKIDLLDFNGDGTDELVMLYNREEDGIFPIVEVWTVEDGKAVQVFSEKTQEESHEAIINFSLYQNDGKLYVPVYDSLDHSPMYVHLYGLDGNGEFREIYQYENNDFYMNQLPDGREFTQFNAVQYYICDRADNYEARKIKMETTLRQEMDKAMGRMTSAYDYGNWGNDRWTSQWGWYREGTDMCAMLALKATDESTLSGDITFYRSFMEQLTITKTGNTGTVTSEFGNFTGTAHFGTGYICLHFEDRMMPDSSSTLSEMLGTTVFCFCLLSSDPDTQTAVSWDPYMNRLQSGFDRTSMLGEWTMAPSQPNTNRHLIRLEPDGTMGFRAEDGSWHDCIYTMDETYFYYVYEETGIVSGGEYTVSGNTLILGGEAEAEPEQELSAYECQGDWAWKDEYGTERGAITLSAESSRRLLGDICLYRRTNVNYSLEIELDGTRGTISSESGVIKGTAEFGEDEIWFYLEDKTLSDGTTISEAFETTSFCFTRSNSEPKEFIKKYDTAVYYSDSLFLGSPSQYNYELAKLGGILSCAAEKSEKELVELLEKIGVCDYHTENFGPLSSFAFAFAYKEMNLDGQDTAVLFIIARGTTNFWEGLADASPFTTSFYGYEAYATPYSFYAQVNNALTKYLEEIDLEPGACPLKVFVTGHSLGGACANLVAAQFNLDKKWKNSLTPNEDVFAYTYGSIDAICVDRPVKGGFAYIHNIYNYYDTFGPNGAVAFTTSGNSMFGKFGHMDFFSHLYSSFNNIFATENHNMEGYLQSLVEHEVKCKSGFTYTAVQCPVDVEVLKDGAVVGRITDNQVDEELFAAHPEIALMVVEDSKYIGVFGDPEAYSLRITATGNGEMSVSTVSFDDTGESYGAAEYPNVVIKNGQVFAMELPGLDAAGSDQEAPELLVMDGDRISGKVNGDGSISPVQSKGDGLQLALLAGIGAIGVLMVFLGGRNMDKTKKVKFPIASIFAVILAFGLLTNLQWLRARSDWMDSKIGYRMVVEFGSAFSTPHRIYQVLLIGSMLLLTILLFMRKRNGLLAGALAIQALLPAFTLVSFLLNCRSRGFFSVYEYELHFGPLMWAIGICGCYVLEILCYLLLTLMAATACDQEGKSKLYKLWYLPGVLSIFIAFGQMVGNIYFMRSDLYCLTIPFLIPMTFLLGRWLTRPYKKEKPAYETVITQAYAEPSNRQIADIYAAPKVFCTGCGRELLPQEAFCSACGAKRPEQLQAEPEEVKKTFCTGCGRELPPDEVFCGACGTRRTK